MKSGSGKSGGTGTAGGNNLRAKSRKRVVILVAGMGLVLSAGVGAYAYRQYRNERRLTVALETGIQATEAKDYPKAVENLARYLRQKPDDVRALEAFVEARPHVEAENYGHLVETMRQLQKLVRLEPNRLEARRELMRMFGRFGYATETREQAEALLKADPKDVEALKWKFMAIVKVRGAGLKEGEAVAEQWAALTPTDPEPYLRLMWVKEQLGRSADDIRGRAAKVPGAAERAPLALLVQGVAYAITDDVPKARALMTEAAGKPLPSQEFAGVLVEQLNRLGLYSDSLAMLRKLAEGGKNENATVALAKRLWELGVPAEVVALTEKSAPTLPVEGKAIRALSLQNLGRGEEAEGIRKELAESKELTGKAWAAVLENLTKSGAASARAVIDACQGAVRADGDQAYLRYFVAESYVQLGETELAIDLMDKVSKQNATWPVPLVRLSALQLERGRAQLALGAAAAAWERSGRTSAPAAVAVAKAWAATVESTDQKGAPPAQLTALIDEIRAKLPGEEQTLRMHVTMLCNAGKTAEASAEIKQALAAAGGKIGEETLLQLAAVSRAYDLGVADACFARAEKDYGLTSGQAFARAVHLYYGNKAADGAKLLAELRAKSGHGEAPDWRLSEARYLELIQDPKAKDAWVSLADAQAENLAVQQMAIQVRSVQKDREFLARVVDRLKKLSGDDGLKWKLAKAKLVLSDNEASSQDLVQTSILLKAVVSASEDMVEPRVLLAQCYDRLGNTGAAIEQMSMAAGQDPSNTNVGLYYSSLLQRQGQFDKARDVLQSVAASGALGVDQRRQAAALLAQQGDSQRAIELLQTTRGESAGSELLLATLYRQRNDAAKVEELCKKMLAKPDPAGVQFVADYYASTGRRDEAQKVLALLDGMTLKPGLKEMVRADFASKHGGSGDTLKELRAAAAAAPANPLTWRAIVQTLLVGGAPDKPVDAAEVRRAVSEGLGATNNDKALAAIQGNVDLLVAMTSDPDYRQLVAAYVANPLATGEGTGTDAAIPPALAAMKAIQASAQAKEGLPMLASRLRTLAELNGRSLPVQTVAVRTYLRIADAQSCSEAARLATRSVQMFPNELDPLRLAVDAAAAGRRWPEALTFARTLRERTPADPLPADIAIANAHMQLKQPRDAAAALKPHQARLFADPVRFAEVIQMYAGAMNQTGDNEVTAGLLWPLAEKSADWRRRWIVLALQCNVDTAAAAWLDRIATILPADATNERAALAEAWHVLSTRSGDERYAKASRALFQQLVERPDVTPQALEAMGVFHENENDPAQAELFYRRALDAKKDLPVSLNNLAMILARRGERLDEATDLATRAVAAAPGMPTIYDTLATVQAKNKKPDDAAATLKRAIDLDPQNMQWKVHLARVYWESGKVKEAKRLAVEIGAMPAPTDADAKVTMRDWEALKTEMEKAPAAAAAP